METLQFDDVRQRIDDDAVFAAEVMQLMSGDPLPADPFPVPIAPPLEWFQPEAPPLNQKVTVSARGQVTGRFFNFDQCILGSGVYDECWTAPTSPTGYNKFHQGDFMVTNTEGETELVKVGMLVPGHSEPDADEEASIEHYNDPTIGVVAVRAYEDEHGGYIRGAVLPGKTYGDVALVSASALSGHWTLAQNTAGVLEWDCIGPSLVVRPGLPLDRDQEALRARLTASYRIVMNPVISPLGQRTGYRGAVVYDDETLNGETPVEDTLVEDDVTAAEEPTPVEPETEEAPLEEPAPAAEEAPAVDEKAMIEGEEGSEEGEPEPEVSEAEALRARLAEVEAAFADMAERFRAVETGWFEFLAGEMELDDVELPQDNPEE